jgi:hypothetical protein
MLDLLMALFVSVVLSAWFVLMGWSEESIKE